MRAGTFLIPLFLVVPILAHAQGVPAPYSDSKAIPETVAYQRAHEVVELLNAGDVDAFATWVETTFASTVLEEAPLEEHRTAFWRLRHDNGPLEIHGARTYDPPRPASTTALIVWSAWADAWRAILLDVDGDDRITSLTINPARPPSDLPKAERLSPEQVAERLGDFVDGLAARDAFSGTVLLAKDDMVLMTRAVGLANRDFDVPVTLDTRFNLGSMNKMLTGVACMQLVEAGKLSLDDPISRFLGDDWLPRVDKSRVELRHLLTHTSGLGSYFNEEFDRSSRLLYRTVDDWKPLLRDETLAFEPGTQWQYSNSGMLVAGAVVEQAAGTDYFEYVRRHITGPAGMADTDCYDTDKANRRLAVGYEMEFAADGTITYRNNLFMHVVRGGPAGGGYSTVEDLFRFSQALRAGKLVTQESLDQLWRPYQERGSAGYGLGFGIENSPTGRIVGHSGGFPGISAVLSMHLEAGYTTAILANLGDMAHTVEDRARELIAAGH